MIRGPHTQYKQSLESGQTAKVQTAKLKGEKSASLLSEYTSRRRCNSTNIDTTFTSPLKCATTADHYAVTLVSAIYTYNFRQLETKTFLLCVNH